MATRRRSSSTASSGRKSRGAASGRASKPASGGFRGAAGAARAEQEKKKQDTKRAQAREQSSLKPFRLYLKEGETKEIAIVDDQLDDLFFTYEHNLKNPQSNYWDIYTGCIKEDQICPVCESQERESYYALMLTVIDFTPYTDRKGVEHAFSRKLMCVKPGQVGKFLRRVKKEGTLRGAVFTLSRDGKSDPQIGNDIEFEEFMDEDELLSYEREWEDRDGKIHKEKCYEVYDYDALFPKPSKAELQKMVGGRAAPGSRAEAEEEFEEEDMEGDEEELEDEDQDDTPWDGDEEEEAPRRGRGRGKAAARGKGRSAGRAARSAAPARPARSSRRAASEEVEEEEEYEEEEEFEEEVEEEVEEEEAPTRRGRASRRSAPASTGRRSSRRR